MAFDPTGAGQRYNNLFDVAVSGGSTYHWADRDLARDDGVLYTKLIKSVPPIRLSAGSIVGSRLVFPDVQIVVDNSDDAVRQIIDDNYGLANATFTWKIGQGAAAADYETRFTGRRRFPGGIDWDDTTVTMSLDNTINALARTLPTNKIFTSVYPNAESKAVFKSIPYVYGDWRTTAGDGETVPAYQIDHTEGTGGRFKVSDLNLKLIEAVYINGASASFTASTSDLNGGEFVLDEAYVTATDIVTVNCLGATDDRTTTGVLLETLPDLTDDILQNLLGVASGNIDSASLATWKMSLSSTERGRRWLGTEKSSNTILAELADEGFVDIVLDEDGQYTFPFRIATSPTSTTVLREADLVPTSGGGRHFKVLRDPEKTYANEVVADYAWHPTYDAAGLISESHGGAAETSDSDSITNVGQRYRRRLKLNWIYQAAGAADRAERELRAFMNELEFLEIAAGPRALTLKPADQFQLIYRKYEILSTLGTSFMVRQITPDFRTMQARILAWNLDDLTPKRYQADASPAWPGATAYDQTVMGFYADAAGEAVPGNADSGGQFYF
jgi:hypothetical protein